MNNSTPTLLSQVSGLDFTSQPLSFGLYVVATHIGNLEDITLRALRVLHQADVIICEEYAVGKKLLNQYQIKDKEIILLNEHNERNEAKQIIMRILESRKVFALISDAGTPAFADPGNDLICEALNFQIPVIPIPGVSCLMTALMAISLPEKKFMYYGFLPAKRELRVDEIKLLDRYTGVNIVLLEAPYRLASILRDLAQVLGKQRKVILAYKLTQYQEKIYDTDLDELLKISEKIPKGEFVLILPARAAISNQPRHRK